ncbi:MAG: hypothetical protein JW733_04935 [Coriobacteriia bacterium]|nr:hypothetical protein [Coriobacteriia bacterium]MBN2847778.1 hypothetical protein [Coriobacteriia bacterium]
MRRFITACTLGIAALLMPTIAWATTVSSTQLIEDPALWDGRTVTFAGEAVGEAMTRGDDVWLHLNDDAYVVGTIEQGMPPSGYNSGQAVVATPELAAAVTVFGDHRHHGDIVEVTGVFNAACPEHSGDMDLHVTSLRVLQPGTAVEDPPDAGKLTLLATTALAAMVAYAAFALRRAAD